MVRIRRTQEEERAWYPKELAKGTTVANQKRTAMDSETELGRKRMHWR